MPIADDGEAYRYRPDLWKSGHLWSRPFEMRASARRRPARLPSAFLQIISKEIHRSLHPRHCRANRTLLRLTHHPFRRFPTSRFPQQLPRLPILFILRHSAAQTNRAHPANRLLGDDVPRVFEYRVCRQKIERPRSILFVIALQVTDISLRAVLVRNGALHLHRYELPRTANHAIKSSRLTDRLAYLQPVLRRPRNKHRLRPLTPLFVVPDNFWLLLFHLPPTPVLVWCLP